MDLSKGLWQGPPPWAVFLIVTAFGAFSLAVSYVAINGLPAGMFGGGNKFPVKGRTVLITGGSQGMGRGVANLLASKGANVILVARDVKKLEEAVQYIRKGALNPDSQRFHYISADVTQASENTRIIREATTWNNGEPPDIVWANAGAAVPKLFLETSPETLKSQMDLNYFAAAYLAQAAMKAWFSSPVEKQSAKRSGKPDPRHFVMTSSVAAFVGLAGYCPYAPAKGALRSLHDTLRNELEMYNGYLSHPSNTTVPKVKVHTVFPATILSPGLEEENKIKHPVTKILEEGDPKQTEDEVAVESIKGLEKGKSIIATQFIGKALRAGGLMGSHRDSVLVDTIFGWVVTLIYPFITADLEKKVRKWGQENGVTLEFRD